MDVHRRRHVAVRDVYKSRGGAATADELLANLDWGADNTVNTAYTLTIDPAGLLYWDVT